MALLVLVTPLQQTCDLPPSFGPEYYDSTINYIEGFPLAAPPAADDHGTIVALDSSGRWDWPWRGRTGNSFEYMTMTAAGTVGSVQTDSASSKTLPATAKVWRLELVNLFRDGNFENPAIDMGPYATVALGSQSEGIYTPSGHSRSLQIVLNTGESRDSYAGWDMKQLLADIISGSFTTPPSYFLRMMIWPNSSIPYHSTTLASLTAGQSEKTTGTPVNSSLFLADRFIDFENSTFFFIAGQLATWNIDEVRSIRADVTPVIRLLLNPADTNPGLVPGQYEFSVWVRLPPDAKTFDNATRTSEPYAAKHTTLGIKQLVADAESGTLQTIRSWQQSYAVASGWQRLVLRMDATNNMDRFDEDSPQPVMELSIAPSRLDAYDAGSIEIALPVLNFYINGF